MEGQKVKETKLVKVEGYNDLKLELRLQLRQRLEEVKGIYEVVKHTDTGI